MASIQSCEIWKFWKIGRPLVQVIDVEIRRKMEGEWCSRDRRA